MVYATFYLNITDKEKLLAYREKAADALAKHGGKVEAASTELTVLDESLPLPSMAAVLSFPSKDAALAWLNDPELQDLHALRRAAGESTMTLIG